MTQSYQGSCLCGQVRFEVQHLSPKAAHCHCVDCRKFHGAAFSTFAEVALEDLTWLSGEALLRTYVAENHSLRQFCSHCGSSLTFAAAATQHQFIEVAMATFDQAPELQPDVHIFCASKVGWLDIADNLPKLQKHRE